MDDPALAAAHHRAIAYLAATEDLADAARAGATAAEDLAHGQLRGDAARAATRLRDAFTRLAVGFDQLADLARDAHLDVSRARFGQLGRDYVDDILGGHDADNVFDDRGRRLGEYDQYGRPPGDPDFGRPPRSADVRWGDGHWGPLPRTDYNRAARGYDYPRDPTDGPDPDEDYTSDARRHSDEVDDCPACGTSAPDPHNVASPDAAACHRHSDDRPDDEFRGRPDEWIAKVRDSWLDPANGPCACGHPENPRWDHTPDGCEFETK